MMTIDENRAAAEHFGQLHNRVAAELARTQMELGTAIIEQYSGTPINGDVMGDIRSKLVDLSQEADEVRYALRVLRRQRKALLRETAQVQ